MNALLAAAILALLTGQSIFTSAAPAARLSGVEITTLCSDVQLKNTEIYWESKHLSESDSDALKDKSDLIEDSMEKIINSIKDNLRVDRYDVRVLQTFLAEIKDKHMKSLETHLIELKPHFGNDKESHDKKDYRILRKKIRTEISKIWIKLSAVTSELQYHNPRLLSSSARIIFANALERFNDIAMSYRAKDVPDEQRVDKIEETIRFIPPFIEEINKLRFQ